MGARLIHVLAAARRVARRFRYRLRHRDRSIRLDFDDESAARVGVADVTLIHGRSSTESCSAIRFAEDYAAAQGWIRLPHTEAAGSSRSPERTVLARSAAGIREKIAARLCRARLRTLDDSAARRQRVQVMLARLGVDLDPALEPHDGTTRAVLVLSPDCLTELRTRPQATLGSLKAILARDPGTWVLFSQRNAAVPTLAPLEPLLTALQETLEGSPREPTLLLAVDDANAQPSGTWESEGSRADLVASAPAP